MTPTTIATHFGLFLRYERALYHVMSKSLQKNKDKLKKKGKAKIHNANGIHNYLTQVVFYMAAKFYERYGLNPDLDEHSLGYHCSGYLDLWNSVVKGSGSSREFDKQAEKKLKHMVGVLPGADFKSISGIRSLRHSDDKVHLMMIIMISSVFYDGEKSKNLVQMEGGEFAGTKEDKGPIFISDDKKILSMTHMSELLPKSGAPTINIDDEETKEWKPNIMNILDFAGTAFKFDESHYDNLRSEDKTHIKNLQLMKMNQWHYPLIKEEDTPSPSKMKTDGGPSRVWSLPKGNRRSNIKSSPNNDSAPDTSEKKTNAEEIATVGAAAGATGQSEGGTETPVSEAKKNETVTGNIELETPASKENAPKTSANASSSAPNPKGGEKRGRDEDEHKASKRLKGEKLFIDDTTAETGKKKAVENENDDDKNANDNQVEEEILDDNDDEGHIHETFEYTDNELRNHHEQWVNTIPQLVATTTLLNTLRHSGELCATKHDISRCIKSVSNCLEVKEKIEDQDIIDCNYTRLSKTASSNDKIRDKYMCITISAKEDDVNYDDIIEFFITDLKDLNWRTTATNVEEVKVIEKNVPLEKHILTGKPIKVMCAPFAQEAYHLVMEAKNNEEVEDDSELVVGNTIGARKPPKKRQTAILDTDDEGGEEDDEGKGVHKQEDIEVDNDNIEVGKDDKEEDKKGTDEKEEDEEGACDKDVNNEMDVDEDDDNNNVNNDDVGEEIC